MDAIKKFFKELKRVRWPKGAEASNTFWKTTLFILICALALFGIAIGFTALWDAWGVGING